MNVYLPSQTITHNLQVTINLVHKTKFEYISFIAIQYEYFSKRPFLQTGINFNPIVDNQLHTPIKKWGMKSIIRYQHSNSGTAAVWEWINILISHLTEHVITCPMLRLKLIHDCKNGPLWLLMEPPVRAQRARRWLCSQKRTKVIGKQQQCLI